MIPCGQTNPRCQGIVSAVTTLFCAVMPLSMGSIAVVINVAVVDQDAAPFLLPIGLVRDIKACMCSDFARVYFGVNPTASSDMEFRA